MSKEIGGVKLVFGDARQPKALPLAHPKARWAEWGTETLILNKGSVRRRGCLPLPCDIKFERDVPVHLRDGTRIYVDVYRPVDDHVRVPALMAWSPYGKQGGLGNQVLDDFPFRMGVPLSKLSEWQKWEGPDPAYWVRYGYAVVNPDARGVYKSEGDIYASGTQEGRDGADVVDWIGGQPWCNGQVGMSGNSYLSISQWFVAAEKPKHLAAIAPWEGSSDWFRESSPGGVLSKPALDFMLQLLSVNVGENTWENPLQTLKEHEAPLPYIEDKAARVPDITVPAYVVASYSNPIHSYGTFRSFCRLRGDKWLRIHDSWEWPDYYEEANRADLHRFYDRYLKDVDNGWESTPRLRAKIIDTENPMPLTGSLFTSTAFPPPEARPLKLFFDTADMKLDSVYPPASVCTYQANKDELVFEYAFTEDMTICGPVAVNLAVSLNGGEDSNVFVYTEKVLASGSVGTQLVIPYQSGWQATAIRTLGRLGVDSRLNILFYKGTWGQANVARRETMETEGVPGLPIVRMEREQPSKEGQVVLLQPHMRPLGMKFRAGEKLRVTVAGANKQTFPEVAGSTLSAEDVPDPNAAGVRVNLHCGDTSEGFNSFLTLPVVQSG